MRRLALALALAAPSPAYADGFTNREIAYQVLNLADAVETSACLRHAECEEANPILGKHPSDAKLWGVKIGGGILHYIVAKHLNDRDPHAAKVFQIVSLVVQGGVVGANLRMVF